MAHYNYNRTNDLVLTAKPSGITTHRSSPTKPGYGELLSSHLDQMIYPTQRLDRETSGALVFPTSKTAAQQLTELFSQRMVQKEYFFITDKVIAAEHIEHSSCIEKRGRKFLSLPRENHNATTRFTRLELNQSHTLWKAEPQTGKTHQIRLHAKDLGIPILGDTLYGGSTFPFLLLHAHALQFLWEGEEIHHTSTPPYIYSNMSMLATSPYTASLYHAVDQRRLAYTWSPDECIRLLHHEFKEVRCDKLGTVVWFYWYDDAFPTTAQQAALSSLATYVDCSEWHIMHMQNRGSTKGIQQGNSLSSTTCPEQWNAQEQGVRYVFRSDQGKSPGLFLDQRSNRSHVGSVARDKRVLNLFCYTAGFSVSAALGGATQVVSVDTSKRTLNWARENFHANDLDPQEYTFIHEDARDYIRRSVKREKTWDIIILDPPSFARTKKKIFRFEKDFSELITQCIKLLAPGGILLIATNYEKISYDDFLQLIREEIRGTKLSISPRLPELDYILGANERLMKSALIQAVE